MASKPKTSPPTALRRLRRTSNRRLGKPQVCHHHRRSAATESVSDKLEALKNLIPSQNDDVKADQLFQETADYIVLLKTQVFVLQKLVDFYGSQQNSDVVV
ncbi:hypothetical protein BUALT_Bualt04G0137700 [Buddleja alternifolia]|uniref:Uncharacterized protein n=1 Tax=Buddleja alternifolia TaxID=168488 RepID=A0AAV6XQW0_9LAMI|nr:hypothetical protein BUALT_Bualt04G0137700 [Buddleja alternifolia]